MFIINSTVSFLHKPEFILLEHQSIPVLQPSLLFQGGDIGILIFLISEIIYMSQIK